MGTRADFYVGRGPEAEWLGSLAWDGYPTGNPAPVIDAHNEADYRGRVTTLLATLDHGTTPEMGWPWPWDDSGTTDYAYAFDGGKVWASGFGSEWFDAKAGEPVDDEGEPTSASNAAVFPDMSARRNMTFGTRSGVMVIGADGPIAAAAIDASEVQS